VRAARFHALVLEVDPGVPGSLGPELAAVALLAAADGATPRALPFGALYPPTPVDVGGSP